MDNQVEKKVLSIDDIEETDDIRYDEIPVWGGVMRVASLTSEDMVDFIEANDGPARKTAGVRLIVKSIVNEKNEHIGTDKHLSLFKKKDSKTIDMIVKRLMILNGIGKEAQEIEKAKNGSGEADSGASPTVLH